MRYLENLKAINATATAVDARASVGKVYSFPQLVALTLLERCNFRCRTCSQSHDSDAVLSPLVVERLRDALPFVSTLSLTGGEPLLHPQVDELLRMGSEAGCNTLIQTNGSLLTDERIERLLDLGVAWIRLSCDGAVPATYNRIRVGGNFHRLLAAVARIGERKAARGLSSPRLEFNFVSMRSNIAELPRLVLLAADLGVSAVNVLQLRAHTEELARESLFFHQELSDEMTRKAAAMAERAGIDLSRPPLFAEAGAAPGACAPAGQAFCDAPWTSLTVNIDGSCAICCGGAGNAGNLNEQEFPEVWSHPGRVAVRERVNTNDEPAACKRCRFGKPQPGNVLSHIPDPELARRIMAEHGLSMDASGA